MLCLFGLLVRNYFKKLYVCTCLENEYQFEFKFFAQADEVGEEERRKV